ncbi:hypothetical protein [Okeania sp. SIO2B3]|uniref:hypothetical protein n=1 Tax=Okeania sp. SIO2B3 TaxID=2607784 RepID=UPI0013C20EDD|nr:hypothetical protein [Okeania sp. SIO2B3]NET44102.1 hypothetical protein [Okeania sp. SIO2B3]
MLKGENLEIVNFPSVGFSDFAEVPIFSGVKARVSIGQSEDFLMVGGEISGVINFSSVGFSDFA